ncbi:hypothetical protein FNV43_RR26435 [Rhamnella rubrinervis]|uniref:Uncharacterized protein n=1 Tax=Rhamnella rubrinervis TaxID=2594499 RepID=A0A8K0DPB0_9ROSA|nr:hypothetical protein FNV43_RR26435 [Rhamnella rubrinervis]
MSPADGGAILQPDIDGVCFSLPLILKFGGRGNVTGLLEGGDFAERIAIVYPYHCGIRSQRGGRLAASSEANATRACPPESYAFGLLLRGSFLKAGRLPCRTEGIFRKYDCDHVLLLDGDPKPFVEIRGCISVKSVWSCIVTGKILKLTTMLMMRWKGVEPILKAIRAARSTRREGVGSLRVWADNLIWLRHVEPREMRHVTLLKARLLDREVDQGIPSLEQAGKASIYDLHHRAARVSSPHLYGQVGRRALYHEMYLAIYSIIIPLKPTKRKANKGQSFGRVALRMTFDHCDVAKQLVLA